MTNADKFLKEGVSVEEFAKGISNIFETSVCANRYGAVMTFLEQQVPPTLTEDERVILRNIDKRYKYIFRPADNELYLCETKGMRYYDEDDREIGHDFLCYKHLFQFIKNGEEYEISELLGE